MPVVSPTLIRRRCHFPLLLPEPPKPHPVPLKPHDSHHSGRLNSHRNLMSEMDDLSDEENELDEAWKALVRNRGFNFLRIIGRLHTQQEEKNDQADTESDDAGSAQSGGPASVVEEGENDSAADLDANMEDLDDEQGDVTGTTDGAEEMEDDGSVP